LTYEKETIFLEGEIRSVSKTPRFHARLEVHYLNLSSLIPETWKNREYLTGILNADLEGAFLGTSLESFWQTLRVKGMVDIRRGALKNLNMLNETVRKMAAIPELKRLLRMEVSADWASLLEGHDTPFEILQADIQLVQGRLDIPSLRLKHAEYLMDAAGSFESSNREIDLTIKLVTLQNLSEFLIRHADKLGVLKNVQGRLVIPLAYQGILPKASIQPDLRYMVESFRQAEGPAEEEEEEED
jgi:hypothetical protein